jgi:hypothetical protein
MLIRPADRGLRLLYLGDIEVDGFPVVTELIGDCDSTTTAISFKALLTVGIDAPLIGDAKRRKLRR